MLRLPLFGYQLNVHLTVALIFLLLVQFGWGMEGASIAFAAIVISVLIHELGHAFTASAAGATVGNITLHMFGGFTLWSGKVSWLQKLSISLAGSGLQVLIGIAAWLAARAGALGATAASALDNPLAPDFGRALAGGGAALFATMFVWASIFWGLINLLPIGGLDGSHILAELLERWVPGRGRLTAAVIGLLVAISAGLILWSRGFGILPFIFVLYAVRDLVAVRR